MFKEFAKWHETKSLLHNKGSRLYFHEREVWWCSLGFNIGFEQDGKGRSFARPVLILKKFNQEIFWALPITSVIKSNKFYFSLILNDRKPRSVILSQLRLIDDKRLIDKVGTINKTNYLNIKKATMDLF